MNCPNCATELKMAERQGVEIDYCPQCRGVWLDRGELDKIIERAQPTEAAMTAGEGERRAAYDSRQAPRPYRDDDYRYGERHGYGQPGYGQRKKKSFLGELFDFD